MIAHGSGPTRGQPRSAFCGKDSLRPKSEEEKDWYFRAHVTHAGYRVWVDRTAGGPAPGLKRRMMKIVRPKGPVFWFADRRGPEIREGIGQTLNARITYSHRADDALNLARVGRGQIEHCADRVAAHAAG